MNKTAEGKKILEYKLLIEAASHGDDDTIPARRLEESVNAYISMGWEPEGSPMIAATGGVVTLMQPIVRRGYEDTIGDDDGSSVGTGIPRQIDNGIYG